MTPKSRIVLLTALIAALVTVGGCTSTVAGDPAADPARPTEGPGSDPVAWVDHVCGAVLSFAVPATAAPDFSASGDLPALQDAVSAYLGSVVAGVQAGMAQLGSVGTAPVEGGDAAVGRIERAMQGLEEDFTAALAAVDAADPAQPSAFLTTLEQVETTITQIAPPDPLSAVAPLPRLSTAAERAGRCQDLGAMARAVPR